LKPFHLSAQDKTSFILKKMNDLTALHTERCEFYRNYLKAMNLNVGEFSSLAQIPFLPARFFKEFLLQSGGNSPDAIAKSSGTSGNVSTITLSHKTMLAQSIALNSIVKSFLGTAQRPMLIFESKSIVANRLEFNARGAGVLGFSKFGSPIHYAIDDKGKVVEEVLPSFFAEVQSFGGGLIFGFTSNIWEALENDFLVSDSVDTSNVVLIHGGGWKKLASLNISNDKFNQQVYSRLKVRDVHNYYGMVEQTGSIFFECEFGNMHASMFSEALARDENTLEPLKNGNKGVIQVFSTLPESYPGHSILTEDVGVVESDKLCKCGRNGSTIKIIGRLAEAEIRGCSDVYG
jgi:phenylacetate-coenzyme A ligase PaaK-like adenylate-forming protein